MSNVVKKNLHQLSNEINESDDPFLSYLLSTKLEKNIDNLRTNILLSTIISTDNIKEVQSDYSRIEFCTSMIQHDVLSIMERNYHKYQNETKKRRYSIDFDTQVLSTDLRDGIDLLELIPNDDGEKTGILDGDESLMELRRRLLGRNSTDDGTAREIDGESISTEKQIKDNENIQQSLIEDMTKLVSSLKQGSTAFQNALDEDNNVLGAAEIGIQVASRNLTDIGGKLRSYDKTKLGYLFYISVVIFMILGLFITFMIIKVFPAL